ncbi:MAG: hypothetical protein MK312_14560 [Roseibacillus sp.]|nr:hypothetical protein [Roseibacillus sp.]
MQTVDTIYEVYRATYASRGGPVAEWREGGVPNDEKGEGLRRLVTFIEIGTTRVPGALINEVDGSPLARVGQLNGISGFEFEIRATDDYNPDPREEDSYGTYLSLTFEGLGAFQHLRIGSQNEQALFIRQAERSRPRSADDPDLREWLMLSRRRGLPSLSTEHAAIEAAFIEAFLAARKG